MAEIKSHRTTCLTDEWDIAQQPFNRHSKTHPNYFIAKIPLRIPGTYLLHSKTCIIKAHKILFLPLCFPRRSCNKSQSFSVFCKTGKKEVESIPSGTEVVTKCCMMAVPFLCLSSSQALPKASTDRHQLCCVYVVCVCSPKWKFTDHYIIQNVLHILNHCWQMDYYLQHS